MNRPYTGASVPAAMTALDVVRRLHSPRSFSGDGYGWTICAEDRQRWPCSTEQGIREALGETDGT